MVYNPFDYIKQVEDDEAKEIVANLKREGKRIRIRTTSYMCFGEDYDEWNEYLVVIEELEKRNPLPCFTYKCHYTLDSTDADNFCNELKKIR